MSYIGQQPLVGNYITCDALTASATTTYNLTTKGNAVTPTLPGNLIVSVNGVTQAPTTAYTISGSTIVFSTALSATDSIDYIVVLGNTLNIGQPSNGTITTAALATTFALPATNGGTGVTTYSTGSLLYASNSTTLATLAVGSSTQVLGVSSGVPAWTSVSSDYVLLASSDASSSASVSFDGYFSSTYRNYTVVYSNILPATNDAALYLRYRRSNADVTANNYISGVNGIRALPGTDTGTETQSYSSTLANITEGNISNTTANGGVDGNLYIYNPLNTSTYKLMTGINSYQASSNYVYAFQNFSILKDSTAALSGITFYMSSGNIASGNFKLYGLK
jgi:hypothetical protein